MSDDHSPGDGRNPYSDTGGKEARHAQTHDVEREKLTNPKGPEPVDESFDEQLAPLTPDAIRLAQNEASTTAADNHDLVGQIHELSKEELATLSILDPETQLEQGSTYLNLEDQSRTPFTAVGGKIAGNMGQVVAKKATDHEVWNKLTRS
ncbi:MAG: hypothetical protein WKF81_09185 [Thermomicrobiales bacterium]